MTAARSLARAAALMSVVCTLLASQACSRGDVHLDTPPGSVDSRPSPVVVVHPDVRSLYDVFLEREATIFPSAQPQIASRQDGVIKQYLPEAGDILNQGDLIAEIEDTQFRLALAEYRAALTRARATLDEVQRSSKRAHELYEQNVISEGELDDRGSALARARADVDEAAARVDRARQDLSELRIVAPIPGVVTQQNAFVGEYVEQGDQIAEMKRIDVVFAVCTVNERYVASIREGAPAWIEVTGHPGKRFEGLIWKVVPDVDVASRSLPIKVMIPNPGLLLTPGMSARVRFVRELDQALLVPKDAVLTDGDDRFVLIAEDGQAKRRTVEIGAAIADQYHVRSGLDGGENVIVAGNEELAAGTAVQLVDLPPPGPPTLPDSSRADRPGPSES